MIRAVEGRAAYHHAWDTGLDKQCPDIIDGDAQLVFIDGKGMPGYRARIDKRNESHPLVGARMDDTTMPIKAGIAVHGVRSEERRVGNESGSRRSECK